MVALFETPHRIHPSRQSKAGTFYRSGTVLPPRSAPEARSRSGLRDRADLRLVIDNAGAAGRREREGWAGEALERLSVFLARPISDLAPDRPGSMWAGVEYSVATVAAFALLPLVLVAGLFGLPGGGSTVASSAPALVESTTIGDIIVVQPGDSLWSIAGQVAPDRDRREVVGTLAAVNGGHELMVGQQILVPYELLD